MPVFQVAPDVEYRTCTYNGCQPAWASYEAADHDDAVLCFALDYWEIIDTFETLDVVVKFTNGNLTFTQVSDDEILAAHAEEE